MSGDRFEGNLTIKGERATTRMGKTAKTASGRFVPVCSRRASKELALATKERRWAITPPHFHNWPLWSPATGSLRSCFSAPFAQPCMLSSCLTSMTRATLCSHGPLPHIFYVCSDVIRDALLSAPTHSMPGLYLPYFSMNYHHLPRHR